MFQKSLLLFFPPLLFNTTKRTPGQKQDTHFQQNLLVISFQIIVLLSYNFRMCGTAIHLKFHCAVKCKKRLAFSVVVRSGVGAYPGQAVDRKGIFAFDVYLYLAHPNHLSLFKKALKCPLILFKIIIEIIIYIVYNQCP